MIGFVAGFILALGLIGLTRVTQNVLALAVIATILKFGISFLVNPNSTWEIYLFGLAVIFVVRLVVFWLLVRFEDSFIVKFLAIIALTLF